MKCSLRPATQILDYECAKVAATACIFSYPLPSLLVATKFEEINFTRYPLMPRFKII